MELRKELEEHLENRLREACGMEVTKKEVEGVEELAPTASGRRFLPYVEKTDEEEEWKKARVAKVGKKGKGKGAPAVGAEATEE